MVEETQSNRETPAPAKRVASALTSERKYALGVIALAICLTTSVFAWGFGWIDFDPPSRNTNNSRSSAMSDNPAPETQKIPLPPDWNSEDIILHVDIPDGWESQNTPYYLFLGSLGVDVEGEAKISPPDTAQSDPTGLTISHFFRREEGYFPLPGRITSGLDGAFMLDDEDLTTKGRHLPEIIGPTHGVAPIGGRDALALSYDLPSPAGTHKCTERQLVVNRVGAIIRLCSPAGADTIPQEYQALLSSAKWAPRAESDFAQSTIITDPAPDTLELPLPEGWRNVGNTEDSSAMNIAPSNTQGFPLMIRRIPPSSISGKWAIYPTNNIPEPCTPEWKKMADTWEPSGEQRWLEERTIDGEKACGFINDPQPHQPTEHHWFVPREDGLWIFNVEVFPPRKPAPIPGAQSGAEQEPQLGREHYKQAYQLLDQVKWTSTAEKGAE
ncbi:MAG: hypothetical protein Q4C87_12265 [Actinomycetaceae bacterium]|nr:hypothetical protein [Actinomycetaceae bacterium]